MRKIMFKILFLIFVLSICSCVLEGAGTSKGFHKTLNADGIQTINITNDTGSIKVESVKGNQIEVYAEKRTALFNGEAELDRIKINIIKNENNLEVYADISDALFAEVDFRIKIPQNIIISATNDTGSIDVEGICDKIENNTGNIDVEGICNKIENNTGDIYMEGTCNYIENNTGNISIRMLEVKNNVEIKNDTGDIRLGVSLDYAVTVEAHVDTGIISDDRRVREGKYKVKVINNTGDIHIYDF